MTEQYLHDNILKIQTPQSAGVSRSLSRNNVLQLFNKIFLSQTLTCFSCSTCSHVVQNIFHSLTMEYVAGLCSTILSLLLLPLTFTCMEQEHKLLLYQSAFLWVSNRRLIQSRSRLKEKERKTITQD